jgi:hypothetical protein
LGREGGKKRRLSRGEDGPGELKDLLRVLLSQVPLNIFTSRPSRFPSLSPFIPLPSHTKKVTTFVLPTVSINDMKQLVIIIIAVNVLEKSKCYPLLSAK